MIGGCGMEYANVVQGNLASCCKRSDKLLLQFEEGILVNNKLDAIFNVFIYFTSLHVSSNPCSSSGESIVSIYRVIYVTYTECYIPDDVLIQLILLITSTGLIETCRELK